MSIDRGHGIATSAVLADSYDLDALIADTEAAKAAAQAAQTAAELALDNFDDRYLGDKTADPTVDNDGDALMDGAMFYDTTLNITKIYDLASTTWKRTTPTTADQTNIDTVSGQSTEIGRLGTADAVADMNTLGTADVVADLNTLGTADVVSDMNTLGTAANVTNMDTLADISSDITTTAGISGNVTTVAGISANTTTVAGISSNVTTVAGNTTNVNTVAGNDANITTVANNITDVNTVATDIAKVIKVADDLNEAISEVETVANDLNEASSEIEVVANNITNVNTVGGISGNVTTVAGNNTNVTTVAGISGNVTTVAGIASDVTAVAADATDIGTVAAADTNIGLVGGSIANVNTVATNIADINDVADNEVNINAVNANSTNINSAVSNASNINSVVSNAGNINAVNANSTNINAVNSNSANINTVAGDASNIATVASNITDVNNFADTYFTGATAPATPTSGDLWFDTTANTMKVYGSAGWANAGSSVNGVDNSVEHTATAGQTSFTATYDPGYLNVFLNGVKLDSSDYTATDGSNVVLDTGATVGDSLFVQAFGTFALSDHYNKVTSDGRYLQDSEVTNLAQVKAFDSSDYATAAHNHSGVYEPADATILKDADIGVTVLSPTGDGSNLTGINTDLVSDTTPQLGGNLDLNSKNITGTGNIPAGNLTGTLPAIDGSALTGVQPFPSGTKMVFAQASAPTGWTQDTANNDKALRVVSGSGGGSGGTHGLSSPPSTSHTHTGASHTHSGPNHRHSTPNHSHSHSLSAGSHTLSTSQMPAHNHSGRKLNGDGNYNQLMSHYGPWLSSQYDTGGMQNTGSSSSHSHSLSGSISSGGGSNSGYASGTTGSGGTGTTSSSGGTAFAPQYVDVIVCSKD